MTYRIHRARERGVWLVFSTGEFARFVAEFPSLPEAERWVVAHADECERCGR